MVALIAVVLVAVILGSALRPTSKPPTFAVDQVPATDLTSYTPVRSIPPSILKAVAKAPTFYGILPAEHKTPLDRLRAWLHRTFDK
jgi:hypothetical protein